LWRTPGAEDAAGRGTYATYESYKKGRLEKGKQISLSNQVKFSQMFPTPTRFDATCGDLDGREYNGQTRHAMKLIQAAKMWPTPKARDFKDTTTLPPSRQKNEGKDSLSQRIGREMSNNGGQLNPTWVEALMGYPLSWTELED
jgi:DNA (cytosine-5)-methyltransferase 1